MEKNETEKLQRRCVVVVDCIVFVVFVAERESEVRPRGNRPYTNQNDLAMGAAGGPRNRRAKS